VDFINQGGRSFQGWLKLYPVAALPLSTPDMLFNCNTPDDLRMVT
jgi:molybdopterin-guanine dinucleotide biosynthesis protein A